MLFYTFISQDGTLEKTRRDSDSGINGWDDSKARFSNSDSSSESRESYLAKYVHHEFASLAILKGVN